MTSIERVYATINHKEPDKVPKGELEIAEELIENLLGRQVEDSFEDIKEVMNMLHMDLVNMWAWQDSSLKKIEKDSQGREIFEDWLGNKMVQTGNSVKCSESAIKEIEDIFSFKFPQVENYNCDHIKKWRQESDFFVFAQIGGGFSSIYPLIGFENYLIGTKTHRKVIECLIEKAIDFYIQLANMAIQSGAHGILIGDDIAYNSGTILSPELLRGMLFPYIRKEVAEIKKLNVPVFFHADGNLNDVLDDIVDMGFDGLHSLQPSAGMNLKEVKIKYGDKLCLMGNIDLDYILPFGKVEDVRKAVKEAVRVAAKDGGYILSTCNVLTKNIPVKNAVAMYEAAEEYGKYRER